jgi:membrane protein implicated in regulation of membrane protease activity
MPESSVWWLLAGAAVAVELLTGTVYLLMLAVGMAAAAISAHLGLGTAMQISLAAGVGGVAVLGWHARQRAKSRDPAPQANANINLDIGETVQISRWKPDGTSDVQYRGAHWVAIHRNGVSPSVGAHRIAELVGNRLLVDKI